MTIIPLWVKLLVLAGVLLLLGAAVSHYNESLREDGRKEVRAQWAEAVRSAQRDEDQSAAERRKKDKETDDATAAALTRFAADASDSRASADRLQRRIDTLLAAARRQPPAGGSTVAAAPGEQGEDPIGMFANMLQRLDEAAGRIGSYADALRIAGEGCERRFDAVTDTQLSPPAGASPASAGPP